MIRYLVRHLATGRTLYRGADYDAALRVYQTSAHDPVELVKEETLVRTPAAEQHDEHRRRAFPWA